MSRKTAVTSFLVICAVAIAATPAFAGGVAFQASSLPVQVRGEGLTEAIGAVVLQATGPGTVTGGSSVTLVYSGSIANSSSFAGGNFNGLNCSVGGSATCFGPAAPAPLVTSATGSQFTVAFPGPNTNLYTFATGDYLVISQIRMNVNALGSAATTVTATLSGTSSIPTSNPITFTQSQVSVASIVNPSVKGSVSTSNAVQTCSVPFGQTAIGGTGNSFKVTAAENYPAALTSAADEASFSAYPAAPGGSAVTVTLANIPSGMAVQAIGYQAAINGSTVVTASGGTTAVQQPFGTAIGAGFLGTTAVASTYNVSTASTLYQASSGSALTYVFTVSGDSTSSIESFTVIFGIGLPNSGGTALAGSNGPLPSLGTIVTATATVSLSPSSGTVSFGTNNEGSGTIATISDCVTNLLFPYVTNQNGYDTSFSVANTTSDDLAFGGAGTGATAQSGSCTLSLWPTTDTTLAAASPLGTASQYTTPTIPAGAVYAFSQSTTSFSGQTGYIIAVCRFLNAHGFAFLTNGFAQAAGPQLSHGYLGLVLPNPINGRSNSAGEGLVQ